MFGYMYSLRIIGNIYTLQKGAHDDALSIFCAEAFPALLHMLKVLHMRWLQLQSQGTDADSSMLTIQKYVTENSI